MKNCNKNLPEQDNFVFLSFAVLKIKEYFFLGKKIEKNRESLLRRDAAHVQHFELFFEEDLRKAF